MAVFQQCTATTAALASSIADAAGASADAQMCTRAGKSLGAAIRHFSNFADWQWALVEAPTLIVTAPFSPLIPGGGASLAASATGGTNSSTTGILTFQVGDATGFGILPGDFIQGPMYAGNTAGRVTATATAGAAPNTSATAGMDNSFNASLWSTAGATALITANRDQYALPSDFKQPYSIRLLNAQYTVRYIGRRHYDRSVTNEFTFAGTPLYYDMFLWGQHGTLRLLRPPASTDRLQIRYYRALDPASATADFPDRYEPYFTSWATWHFLINKADSSERAAAFLQFAQSGLQQMLKENVNEPDADLMFLPGHYSFNLPLGPNSVRQYLQDEW